ncbi:hypothetical protein OS493_000463 [Desmophyllum pertusum]|uniref:RRM domain-containing protein n=1 Tax=Desmophyllum pertusum TaxID=174260 RepID=A0A9X0A7L6_9CNID|nr:hypothetical protein OS493_000463 [Desmophyllum pertusum]
MEAEINAAPIGQFKGSEIDFRARRGEPDQRQKFEQVKLEFINLLIGNIRARFPNVDLLSAMEIFEPQSYPADQRLLVGWGNGNLQTLLDHYGCPMENQLRARFDSVVDSEACRGEFLPFKRLLHHNLGENRQNDAGVVRWHYYTPVEVMKHTFGDRMQVNQAIFPGVSNLFIYFLLRYGAPYNTEYKLNVENLSSRASWQDLKDYMRQAGEVTFTQCHRDRIGEGVVEFASQNDMQKALKRLDGTELLGKRIRLTESQRNRQRRSSRSLSPRRRASRSRSRSQRRSHSPAARGRRSHSPLAQRGRSLSPRPGGSPGRRLYSN